MATEGAALPGRPLRPYGLARLPQWHIVCVLAAAAETASIAETLSRIGQCAFTSHALANTREGKGSWCEREGERERECGEGDAAGSGAQ